MHADPNVLEVTDWQVYVPAEVHARGFALLPNTAAPAQAWYDDREDAPAKAGNRITSVADVSAYNDFVQTTGSPGRDGRFAAKPWNTPLDQEFMNT